MLVIHQGRLEQAGTQAEILDHPATEFIARFVGDVNVLDGTASGGPATIRRLVHLGDRVKVEAQVDGAGVVFAQLSRYDPVLGELEPGARVAVDVEHARSYPLSPLQPAPAA